MFDFQGKPNCYWLAQPDWTVFGKCVRVCFFLKTEVWFWKFLSFERQLSCESFWKLHLQLWAAIGYKSNWYCSPASAKIQRYRMILLRQSKRLSPIYLLKSSQRSLAFSFTSSNWRKKVYTFLTQVANYNYPIIESSYYGEIHKWKAKPSERYYYNRSADVS